ncbi:hypothetical protein JCM19235_5476 [Vibrio maritimus]|uniref:Arginine/ornithine antiporter ArcD n=1 Tax=Vibrio maritimus TaxID=990268 RepID=A0A090SBK6_9VIBR|nr:hypothetical protein JCM19235_5476 [Vibrio maritimus]
MVVFFTFFLSLYYLIAFPGGVRAYQKGQLSLGDAFLPLSVFATWSLLATSGIGAQSLGNLVELVFLLGASVALFYIRLWYVKLHPTNAALSLIALYCIVITLVVLTRMSFPLIPE